jgi:hypothetical protein
LGISWSADWGFADFEARGLGIGVLRISGSGDWGCRGPGIGVLGISGPGGWGFGDPAPATVPRLQTQLRLRQPSNSGIWALGNVEFRDLGCAKREIPGLGCGKRGLPGFGM